MSFSPFQISLASLECLTNPCKQICVRPGAKVTRPHFTYYSFSPSTPARELRRSDPRGNLNLSQRRAGLVWTSHSDNYKLSKLYSLLPSFSLTAKQIHVHCDKSGKHEKSTSLKKKVKIFHNVDLVSPTMEEGRIWLIITLSLSTWAWQWT